MAEQISRFTGNYRFLSNFYRSPLLWDYLHYPTAEHAFQAGKTFDRSVRERIAAAPTPAEAKRLGGPPARGGIITDLRTDWDVKSRHVVMFAVLQQKFADDYLRAQLLATGDAELVEGNDWHDTHWGVCQCRRHDNVGENQLGKMLMLLRAGLREEPGSPA